MEKQEFVLKKCNELRIEVDYGKHLNATLKKGEAEIFGAELGLGERVTITGDKVAIFTYNGCTIDVEGQADILYVSEETPMQYFLNTHHVLENRRREAKEKGGEGPRVIIVGPTDSGKSTLCKILMNYAIRMEWAPVYVDVDIGQGSIAPPGTIAATPVQLPVTVDDGYPLDVPLVYFHGHTTPSQNPFCYKHLVERMAALLDKRAQKVESAAAAGMFINTMGWVEDLGYDLLLHTVQTLKANIILIVGQERLYSRLTADVKKGSNQDATLIRLPKSGGVVTRSRELRKASRANRVRDYFYGVSRDLMPHSETSPVSDLQIYRVGPGQRAPSSALPIGAASSQEPLRLHPVRINNEIFNSLLAVSHAKAIDEVLSMSIAGFIYIQSVDLDEEGNGTVTYLSPGPGKLPGRFLLMGSIEILNFS